MEKETENCFYRLSHGYTVLFHFGLFGFFKQDSYSSGWIEEASLDLPSS